MTRLTRPGMLRDRLLRKARSASETHCAAGTSTIDNAQQIERGYERINERLNALGAKITRHPVRAE